VNVLPDSKGKTPNGTVYSDGKFPCDKVGDERPGSSCNPIVAAFIAGAARLMLALLETEVRNRGGSAEQIFQALQPRASGEPIALDPSIGSRRKRTLESQRSNEDTPDDNIATVVLFFFFSGINGCLYQQVKR